MGVFLASWISTSAGMSAVEVETEAETDVEPMIQAAIATVMRLSFLVNIMYSLDRV